MAEETIAETVIKSIFISIFMLLSIIGNILVCIAIRKYKRLKTLTNYYVFNLAIADLLYGLTGMPMFLITTIARKWMLGPALCQLSGTLQTLFVLVSIWTLCLIGINRYIAVRKHASYKSIYKKKKVFISIGVVWCAAGLVSVSPQVGWSSIRQGDNFCTINGKDNISYSIFVIIFAYIAPLVSLSCLYTKIFFLLKDHEKKMIEMRSESVKGRSESEYDSVELSSANKSDRMSAKNTLQDIRFDNNSHEVARSANNAYDEGLNNGIPSEGTMPENGGELHSNVCESSRQGDRGIEISDQEINKGNDPMTESSQQKNGYIDISVPKDNSEENIRDSRTVSSSAIHLIKETKQNVNGVKQPETPETQHKSIVRPRKSRALSGLTNALKIRRSTTSKKIKKFRLEAKITQMLFVVVAVFFICWTPLVVGTILYAVDAEPKNFNLLSLGFMFASMNSICNPIIYAFMNESFRKAFKDLFSGCKSVPEEPRTET